MPTSLYPRFRAAIRNTPATGRLLRALSQLEPAQRRSAWSVYRQLRRDIVRHRFVSDYAQLALQLAQRVRSGAPYVAVSMGIKLAQCVWLQLLSTADGSQRARRALVNEGFFLLRKLVRESLGLRPAEPLLAWRRGTPPGRPCWRLVTDGSCRLGQSGIGFAAFDESGELRVALSRRLGGAHPLAAEVAAADEALRMMAALGVQHLVLHTDSLAVLRAFEQRLGPRYARAQRRLAVLASRFQWLEVEVVSRVDTHVADTLAGDAIAEPACR